MVSIGCEAVATPRLSLIYILEVFGGKIFLASKFL